jgi:hypothetical protein
MIKLTPEQVSAIIKRWLEPERETYTGLVRAVEAEVLRLNGGGGEAVKRRLVQIHDALCSDIGDTDPDVPEDMTDEEVRDEMPVFWAAKEIAALIGDAPWDRYCVAPQPQQAEPGAVMEGWQPIETAPKDFVTEFDGWNGERVTNVIWAHPEYAPKGEYDWCYQDYVQHHGWVTERVRGLTHWMPLPPAPGSTKT